MPFDQKSLTHSETYVKISHVSFEGPLSELISEEEFNSMSQQEIEQKNFINCQKWLAI